MSGFVIPEKTRLDQTAASDPARSAWVDANAGSGKTHVLARRVVRLLLRGVPPGRLLCLTYTKAAAANMANRVLKDLAKFATAPDDELDRLIVETDGGVPGEARRARARRLFAEALETPGGLKVQTIHAFCDRVLHQFPFEAGVPAGFSVLDERQAGELLAEARARVMVEAAADVDGDLGRALESAIAAASDDGLKSALDEAVKNRHAIAEWLASAGGITGAVAQIAAALGLSPGDTVAAIEADMLASPLIARGDWPALAALFAAGGVKDQQLAGYLETAAAAENGDVALASYLRVFLTDKDEPRSDKVFPSKRIRDGHPAFAQALTAERDRLVALLDRRRAAVASERSAALLVLAAAVIARYETAKARRALLDFEDMVGRTRDLLHHVGASWVLYKLDRGIDHVLVDEAQDTSAAQWAIIQALAAEFFAGKGASERSRTVFAVGDAKQSIYGFQGAAPAMFGAMQRHFTRAAGESGLTAVRLDVSFRSAQPVLDAVDTVFANPAARAGLSIADDAALVHQSVRAGAPGVVELWPLLEPDTAAEAGEAWDLPLDAATEASPQVRLARNIAASVASWTGGARRKANGAPILPGDILILVRRRGVLFEAVLKALKDLGLPVAGADRLVLAEHIAVMDLMALGDALLTAHDDLALACVLKSPLFGFTDDELVPLANPRTGTLADALAASTDLKARDAAARLALWRDEARALRPFDFYARVLGRDGGRRAMLARLGPEAADPLDEFLGLALNDEAVGVPALAGFLARVRAAGAEIKRDMEVASAAVRVMTVHGAKGLEAPVVILADTVARPEGSKDPRLLPLARPGAPEGAPRPLLWVPVKAGEPVAAAAARAVVRAEAADEYRRLLYVALTRAADVLVVAGARGKAKQPDGCWHDLVTAALEHAATKEPADGWDGTVWRWSRWPQPEAPAAVAAASAPPARPDWLDRPAPMPPARPGRLSPSRRGPPQDEAAVARGLLVHRLLQILPDIEPAGRASAAAVIASRAGLDERAAAAPIADTLALIADPRLARLFGPGSRAEVPIAGRVAQAGMAETVSGRIDRLWIGDDTILFADFKTGTMVPESAEAASPAHLRQLALYRALLADLFPGRPVAGWLVFTAGPAVLPVPDTLLEAALARLGIAPGLP
ncbi:double-strand break repair helicase AddA [Blastochloris tepida]|uniref:DNA 3'-5' helicase n=1 Tax=Blastochloris tepida TaxID=2233851 RepID=A0A348G4M1_9HYPH|nr:double-strand break repair helicase AddA [Blastochloris tepida]BBF94504.1 double-strand break repair helicase AddA [Blastochloris tepida]